MPNDAAREDFERRLLALVRDWFEGAKQSYANGFEITDFIVVYHVQEAPAEDERRLPWEGGRYPGWVPRTAISSTCTTWDLDEAMLSVALEIARGERGVQMRRRDEEDALDDE